MSAAFVVRYNIASAGRISNWLFGAYSSENSGTLDWARVDIYGPTYYAHNGFSLSRSSYGTYAQIPCQGDFRSVYGLPDGVAPLGDSGSGYYRMELSGTPTHVGKYNCTITGDAGATEFLLIVEDASIVLPPIVPSGRILVGLVANAFNQSPPLTDAAIRPVTGWAITGYPAWASVNTSTGAITGTPTESGSTVISVTATGPGGTSDTVDVTLSIAPLEGTGTDTGGTDTGDTTDATTNLTWRQARVYALAGVPVRRASWPTSKTLAFSAGPGSVRAVAAITNTAVAPATVLPVKAADFVLADFEATDWRKA